LAPLSAQLLHAQGSLSSPAKLQLENRQVDSSRGGIWPSFGGVSRLIVNDVCDFIGNRNVRQFPGAFAGAFRFQVPQRAVQRISGRTGSEQLPAVYRDPNRRSLDGFDLRQNRIGALIVRAIGTPFAASVYCPH
jgi:hypothetical protein